MESSTNSERQPLPVGGAIQPRSSGNVAPHIRRKSSTAKLVVERLVRTRERLWATGISATVAAIPALLVGYTLGYPSSTLSELTALPSDFRFSDLLASLFGVSVEENMTMHVCNHVLFLKPYNGGQPTPHAWS